MTEPRVPKQAATVILLRRAEPKGFEVFLTRRRENMPFLGGMYCFPGGIVAKSDCTSRMIECCSGLTPKEARKILGARFRPQEAIGFWIAAAREVFEEVGVLIAVDESGSAVSMTAERAQRLAEKRQALSSHSLSFVELLETEKLFCDLASLGAFSYWQTPAQVSMRFDTRFFVAALPLGQTPLAASYELAHSIWLSPDRAIKLFDRGELPMIFPTFASLRTLADFDTLESVLREFLPPRPA